MHDIPTRLDHISGFDKLIFRYIIKHNLKASTYMHTCLFICTHARRYTRKYSSDAFLIITKAVYEILKCCPLKCLIHFTMCMQTVSACACAQMFHVVYLKVSSQVHQPGNSPQAWCCQLNCVLPSYRWHFEGKLKNRDTSWSCDRLDYGHMTAAVHSWSGQIVPLVMVHGRLSYLNVDGF